MSSRFPVAAAAALALAVFASCIPLDCLAQRKVSLTVYSQDMAFVRERREISLKKGENEVLFPDVPSMIDPSSVRVAFPEGDHAARVLEQSYSYDVADMGRLLELGLGQEVGVTLRGGELVRGILIGHDGESLIVREETSIIRDEDEAVIAVRREHVADVRFPNLGGDLDLRPTLSWRMSSDDKATTEIEASYIVSGMSWGVEYVAAVTGDDGPMELSAWASIENRSGGAFEDAALTLVAGQVHRAPDARPKRMEMMMSAGAQSDFAEEELFEYHAYALDRTLTIGNNESVQIPFFAPAEVSIKRVYAYDAERFPSGVRVTAKTENAAESGLGKPLPSGKVRVYAGGKGVEPRLVGEDLLGDTPVGSEIELFIGSAFDVKGERRRTAYQHQGRNDYEESYEIKLRNSKSAPVEVLVVEHPRGDWTITQTSHTYEEKDSNTVQWTVTVPPSSEVAVSYTVQFRS